jgi:hypothetical protein
MNRLGLLASACCVAAMSGSALAQAPDPVISALAQEWQVSETSRVHFSEALQKLMQAYEAQKKQQAVIDAYWKDYVAGLTKDTQTGSN